MAPSQAVTMETNGTMSSMELPDEVIAEPTFRRVRFADLDMGEEYFVKYRSENQNVDQYIMVTGISGLYPQTVYYTVIQEREEDDGPWNNADYINDVTKAQVNGTFAGIKAHFYVRRSENNSNANSNNNNNANNWSNFNSNISYSTTNNSIEEVNAEQGALLAAVPRPLRPGQRLLLNVEARNGLPAFRVVSRNRRRNKKKTQRRKRRSI